MKADGAPAWNSFHSKSRTCVCSARCFWALSSFFVVVFFNLRLCAFSARSRTTKWEHTHKSHLCLQRAQQCSNSRHLRSPCCVYKRRPGSEKCSITTQKTPEFVVWGRLGGLQGDPPRRRRKQKSQKTRATCCSYTMLRKVRQRSANNAAGLATQWPAVRTHNAGGVYLLFSAFPEDVRDVCSVLRPEVRDVGSFIAGEKERALWHPLAHRWQPIAWPQWTVIYFFTL